MIKKTLCFNNPAYLSLRDNQLVIKLPEVEKADNLTVDFKKSTEVTRPIEDIGVLVLSHAFMYDIAQAWKMQRCTENG